MPQIVLSTGRREEFVEITGQVQQLVDDAGLGEGLVHLMSLHTTAGLTINENADPDVRSDMLIALEAIAPQRREFRHSEGNSPAHVKASLMGLGLTVPVSAGRLVLGRWQGIYFCEFDGPRQGRTVQVSFLPSAA